MTPFSNVPGRVLRGIVRLLLVAAATVFVLSFLLAALFAVLLTSLWSLLTGRKPAPVVLFSRMREQSRRYTQGVWPGRPAPGDSRATADVVDVQATEVHETPLQRLR